MNPLWAHTLRRVELFFKRLLTPRITHHGKAFDSHGHPMRKNFWCDSKPRLCVPCIRLRYGLKQGRIPNLIQFFTKTHIWLWSKFPVKITRYRKDGQRVTDVEVLRVA